MDHGKANKISTRRLFLALWPHEALKVQLAEHMQRWIWPAGCVLYVPADWHVTLHFLGNVQTEWVPVIESSAGVPLEPFELVLDQPRLWPRGLAVLCASEVPQALRVLHGRLEQALRGLSLAVETRPYLPHVTLARHASAAIAPAICSPVVWPVRSHALVVSTGDQDQRYQVIRHYGGW